jgi:A118 family predicted phage portal protein
MNTSVIQELSAVMVQRGYRVPTTSIYQKMREWVDFYMGEVTDFHKFNLKTIDGRTHTIAKPSLNAMKMVCETYSSLLWNEKSGLKVDKVNQEKLDKVISNNNIYGELNTFLEKVALYGTGVAIEYVADKETRIGFSYGDSMVITDYNNTTPKGIVLIQRLQKNKKFYSHVTIHTHKDGVYRVEHEVYESDKKVKLGNKKMTLQPIFTEKESKALQHVVIENDNKVVKFYVEHKTETPHFQVFKYSIANNFDFSPLGISVCANSMGVLKSLDDKFFSSIEDSVNSRKKIFFDDESSKSEMTKHYNETTDTVVVDYVEYLDRDQTLYKTAKLGEEKLQIYAPVYSPLAHTEAIQFDLNLLSLKTRLGKNYFNFTEGGVYVNQANVFSSNSGMWRNRQANANLLKIFLNNMMKSIMFLEDIENKEYEVQLDDSMIINDDEELTNMKADAEAEVIPMWRYIAKRYKLTKSEAVKWVKEANEITEETLGVNVNKIKAIGDAITSGAISIRDAQRVLNDGKLDDDELEIAYIRTLVEKGIALTPTQAEKYNSIE